jgi:hypothetical protein
MLTEAGEATMVSLGALHRDELRRMDAVLELPKWHDEHPTEIGDGR